MEKDLAEERKKIEPELPDIMTWLLRAYNEVPEKTPKINLDMYGDSQLIITAGSDTTAAALAAIFCELASAPDQIAKLRDELVGHTENFRDVALGLRGLPHLDAVINEALRLHPPVPSGAQRMTPPQGLKIGHVNVPGNTMVQIPHHAMFRGTLAPTASVSKNMDGLANHKYVDERCWVRPNEFIPERWTNQPELFIDGSVYIPFLIGTFIILYNQQRMVITCLFL